MEVFKAHDIDPFKYGVLCYDKWEAVEEEKDENGNVIIPARPAGDRYSLRYEEALCIEAAYQRRRADKTEKKLKAIEKRIKAIENAIK